jgi:predicted nucleic acid-binding protein
MMLDSSFLIDLLRGDERAVETAKSLDDEPVSISSIVRFEVFQGLSVNHRKRLERDFASLATIAFDADQADIAASIADRLYRKGEPIDPQDAMIAAAAIATGKTLLTRNEKHFSRIPQLRTETY